MREVVDGIRDGLANRSTAAFEDFYFDVCTMDYAKMSRAAEPLVELMEATDRVRLKAPGNCR